MTDLVNPAVPLRQAREAFERAYLAAQIAACAGNMSRAAAATGMERSAFHRKVKELGVRVPAEVQA